MLLRSISAPTCGVTVSAGGSTRGSTSPHRTRHPRDSGMYTSRSTVIEQIEPIGQGILEHPVHKKKEVLKRKKSHDRNRHVNVLFIIHIIN